MTYVSLDEYKRTIETWSCEDLKKHDPNKARVPGAENFQKKKIYEFVLKKKCESSANDKVAIQFAIKHLSKIADELDENGFVELANILDETLQKFAELSCENCK